MRKLNIGCGDRFLEDWVNIDITSRSPFVLEADITTGLPFEDGHFDVVYSSHVIEHLNVEDAVRLLEECKRILKNGGILRLVFPDLEELARRYLLALGVVKRDSVPENVLKYEWSKIELIDQMVRERPGGKYIEFVDRYAVENWDWLQERVGPDLDPSKLCRNHSSVVGENTTPARLLSVVKNSVWKVLRDGFRARTRKRSSFTSSGELHKWMYDEFSIVILLSNLGFGKSQKCAQRRARFPVGIQISG